MGPNYYYTLLSIVANLFSGKYYTLNDIPCGNVPHLVEAYKFLLLCYEELFSTCFEYRRRSKPLIVALKNWIRQHKLVVNPKFACIENDFTYVTMRKESGFGVVLEFIALIDGIELPELTRDNALLDIVIHAADTVVSWSEDLVRLRKDLEKGTPAHMNVVTWKMESDDQSLKKSLQTFFQCQQEHAIDYIQFRQMLKEWFVNDLPVHQFVMLMDYYIDGLLTMALRRREGCSAINYKVKDVFVCKQGALDVNENWTP